MKSVLVHFSGRNGVGSATRKDMLVRNTSNNNYAKTITYAHMYETQQFSDHSVVWRSSCAYNVRTTTQQHLCTQCTHRRSQHMNAVLSKRRADSNINLRTSIAKKALIDEAAELLGQKRTEFILDTACERAHAVLADRTRIEVDAEKFAAFVRVLERPVGAAVLRMLAKRAPWER